MRIAAIFIGIVALMAGPMQAQVAPPPPAPEDQTPPARPSQQMTGKERLGEKWTDEQRIDDCKVPPDKRSRPRPTACPNLPNS